MIITKKIECYVSETDPDLRKVYISTLYSWLADVRRAANMIVAHKFVQCQMAEFANIDDELRDKFLTSVRFKQPRLGTLLLSVAISRSEGISSYDNHRHSECKVPTAHNMMSKIEKLTNKKNYL